MKLNILYAATLFLSSNTLEVKASHAYWGQETDCASTSPYSGYTPNGFGSDEGCWWGAGAVGEACTQATGGVGTGCAHGVCSSNVCALCTADADCPNGAVCAVGLGACTTGVGLDVCTAHSQCDSSVPYCAYFDPSEYLVGGYRCHDGANGKSCDANDQCSSGYCDTSNNDCHDGAIGNTCGANSDCESGYCDSATSLCAIRPPPPVDPCLSVNCGNGGK